MTHDSDPVRPESSLQSFEGSLELHEIKSQIDTDIITVHLLEARLARNDRIIIPSIQSPNPFLGQVSLDTAHGKAWDAPIVASVTIGDVPTANNLTLVPLARAPMEVRDYYGYVHGADPFDIRWLVLARAVYQDRHAEVIGDAVVNRQIRLLVVGVTFAGASLVYQI
jgi:hypothetical protein